MRSVLAAQALPRAHAALAWVYGNYFSIQSTVDKVFFGFDALSTVLQGVDMGLGALDRMAARLEHSEFNYSSDKFIRGKQVGNVAGQNLGDSYPRIDHIEGDTLVSIKSTVQVDTPDALLRRVRETANELEKLDNVGVLEGRDQNGNSQRIIPKQHPGRALLIAIPKEPLRWNPAPVWRQIREISQRTRVAIRIVPVRGLRGR